MPGCTDERPARSTLKRLWTTGLASTSTHRRCGGDCTEASLTATVCAGDSLRCINLDACNYNPEANISGSCVSTPDNFGDCAGTTLTRTTACATKKSQVHRRFGATTAQTPDDDGSCEYCSCAENALHSC